MVHAIAILMLSCLNLGPVDEPQVRISLFSLFKPESMIARVVGGPGATIELDGRRDLRFAPGDTLRIRLLANRVSITKIDSSGKAERSLSAEVLRIAPSVSGAIELVLPRKIRRVVRGEIFVSPGDGDLRGQLKIVLDTDRESAVASVVAAEMSGERAIQAIRALAVVVRTFMMANPSRHADAGFDICDTTHCQLYRGEQDLVAEAASPVVASAVASTKAEVLSFAGRSVAAYYTSSCGGLSATPQMVWGGTDDGYSYRRVACHWCHRQRFFRWRRSADTALVVSALARYFREPISDSATISTDNEPSSQFVLTVTVRGAHSERALRADSFRRALGLTLGWNTVLSPSFTVERRGARFIFRGRGFGSQVGLCLAGSIAQASAGMSYKEILSFYFPGTEIVGGPGRE